MGATTNAVFGVAFLILAIALTFLMFYLWKFPFDKERHVSSAPRPLMNLHRLLGWVFVGIYVLLMWDMVPRLWSYQVELPARTVVHLTLGMAIGAILLIKVAVVRYFKHMEATLAPILGTSLLIFTLLLTGLAVPYAAREAYLRATAQDGDAFSPDRIERVATFLPLLGFEDERGLEVLASSAGLSEGRAVLTRKCTQCHDLRTILVKPRTPEAWRSTVSRMATRAGALNPINESEQWSVTAYLIAISPTLQQTAAERRRLMLESDASAVAVEEAALDVEVTAPDTVDLAAAQGVFEQKCSQCHSPQLVRGTVFTTTEDVSSLVTRMVSNGLTAEADELGQIIAYLSAEYVEG
ncbi:MAG: hypothetical protein AAGM21_15185 [Pseudomonadota bacterium]